MNLRFSGNRALILGGSCNLAMTLAEDMIAAGLFPILTYRTQKGLHNLSGRLASHPGQYATAFLDFADRSSIGPMMAQLNQDVDFLVDFVQGDYESLIASADEETVYRYFSENVSFRAEIIKKTARIMLLKKRGRFIYISSAAAKKPNPGQGFYAAAKAASEALYRNLGLELGGRGITTLTLRPGYIDAGRGRAFMQSHEAEALGNVPIKRFLNAKEVSETILFYLSDSTKGFNAAEIVMDGGLSAGK